MLKTIDFKWDLLERIKRNSEDWELGKGNESGINLKEICPGGNNKVVIYISLYHDKCLLFMLELY